MVVCRGRHIILRIDSFSFQTVTFVHPVFAKTAVNYVNVL